MKVNTSPNIGDVLFLYHHKVVVIKTYTEFQLVKVRCLSNNTEFYIDYHALSKKINYVSSVDISKVTNNY